jgi:hypothetical protein
MKLTFNERGEWVTPDGEYAIGRVREITFCDAAHPMRWRTEPTALAPNGILMTGHCEGNQEHDRECGWDIHDRSGRPVANDDLYPTLREARVALAAHLKVREERHARLIADREDALAICAEVTL